MTITGLFYLPVPPSTVNSPSAALISQLSNKYPSQAHKPYHLDHCLYVDTSSLLPATNTGSQGGSSTSTTNNVSRQYTHLLTTSHTPQSTFVGTTAKNDVNDLIIITIPSEGQDGFMQLLNLKMQALWAHRQSFVLEGVSVDLPLRDEEHWTVRVGDLRSAGTGLSRAAGGSGTGAVRAVLVEVQYDRDVQTEGQLENELSLEAYKNLLRGLLKRLFRDVTDLNFEGANGLVGKTGEEVISSEPPDRKDRFPGWDLATLYMEVLRGTRG